MEVKVMDPVDVLLNQEMSSLIINLSFQLIRNS